MSVDVEQQQFFWSVSGYSSEDSDYGYSYEAKKYYVNTFDGFGNIVNVDEYNVVKYSNGYKEETITEDILKFSYDDAGNLLKYEDGKYCAEFTYSDELVNHSWERVLPLFYTNLHYVWRAPVFWNVI